MKIIIYNPTFCQIDKEGIEIFSPYFTYEYEYWIQHQYKKERKICKASMIDKAGFFLTGFLHRILQLANQKNIQIDIIEKEKQEKIPHIQPSLKNLKLRTDQIDIINQLLNNQRGVIQAPMGIGKTVLAMGIATCFPKRSVLFLLNEKTLLTQTYQEFKKQEFYDVRCYYAGNKDKLGGITIATTQSIVRLDPSQYASLFDIVIVDEAHIGMDLNSSNYKILTNLMSPIKIGLTATLPENPRHKLFLEGLIGPVVGKMTFQEAIDLNLLAKPKIKLIKVPYNYDTRMLHKYSDVYTHGIVKNKSRNLLIMRTAKNYIDNKNKTVLILVTQIDHGKEIANIAKNIFSIDVPFVWSDIDINERTNLRLALDNKQLKCVIANAVWKHGINIPSLGVVINAAGEKSEVATLQRIGRGFRKTKDKDEIIIVDFFDSSHPYLISHFGHRVTLYMEENWL